MAERNKKLTTFEQEQISTARKILDYKLSAEANVVSILYKNPDEIFNTNLTVKDFHSLTWKCYFQIIHDIIVVEKKNAIDEIVVGMYLEKHPNLMKQYEEDGGFNTIVAAGEYVKEENLEGYIIELHKWNAVFQMNKLGFPVKDRLEEFTNKTAEEIYDHFTIHLNNIFSNIDNNVKSYNGFEGMKEFVDELDKGRNKGIEFYNCNVLNKETGGMIGGNIYGFGASSGVGKSTLSINYIFPTMMKHGLRAVFIINEEDQTKFKKEALCWYATNVLKHPIKKHILRDGGFDDETRNILYKASEWFESQKEKKTITIIPLEQYSARLVIKLLKKYSKMGTDVIVLDTLKESCDARDKESWKSLMTDCVDFYDVIKHTSTCMIVTYQLVKNKSKYLSNADIGISKGILDVFSVNVFFRRPFYSEYEDEKQALHCYKIQSKSKIPFGLKKDTHYMIAFISKNRFGNSDIQIVSEADFSINKYEDLGYCEVPQDY